MTQRCAIAGSAYGPLPTTATACDARRVPAPFANMLKGGHPNSLGRTEEVVGIVLADHARLEELFATMANPDAVVRMRVGDALEKICREQPGWFMADVDRLLGDLGHIEQPSVQWHVAQMLQHLRSDLWRPGAAGHRVASAQPDQIDRLDRPLRDYGRPDGLGQSRAAVGRLARARTRAPTTGSAQVGRQAGLEASARSGGMRFLT